MHGIHVLALSTDRRLGLMALMIPHGRRGSRRGRRDRPQWCDGRWVGEHGQGREDVRPRTHPVLEVQARDGRGFRVRQWVLVRE